MVGNNQDRRAVRTEKAIRAAFQELLMAGVHPIKVTQLADKAGINRKTFYSHYETIDDLVRAFIRDVQNDLLTRLNSHPVEEYLNKRGLLIDVFTDFFVANRDFYISILTQGEYWPTVQQFQDESIIRLASRFAAHTKMAQDDAALLIAYTSSTLLAMMRMRVMGQITMSTTEIRAKIEQLTFDGLNGTKNDHIFR